MNTRRNSVWGLCLASLLLPIPRVASAYEYPQYLHNAFYSRYEGEWRRMPEFDKLVPTQRVSADTFDVSSLGKDADLALRYTATLEIPVDGNYLFTQTAGDSSVVFLDGRAVVINDGGTERRTCTVETLVPMSSGRHQITARYLLRKERQRILRLCVEGPDLYRVDRLHWLYLGWEDDHPKSWSFMGGTIVPGRRQRVQFAVEEDGKMYVPDESGKSRRTYIRWSLADGFLPSPVSEWKTRSIGVRIQHFANRIRGGTATAVYSRVSLKNQALTERTATLVVNAGPEEEVPLTLAPSRSNSHFMFFELALPPGGTVHVDFVARANGDASAKDLVSAGSLDSNYRSMAAFYTNRLDTLTHPVTLPNQTLVGLYTTAQILLWESIVKAGNGDVEMRGSGGNPAGYYQYDRIFSHDVPNMVDQLIRGGDFGTAKRIMESEYYQRLGRELQHNYLDAIPKYLIPYATYLQFSGDKGYFTPELMRALRSAARAIHDHRDFAVEGPYRGIMNRSQTLDNPPYYLLVDNFAALHGLAAYRAISSALQDTAETAWADKEMGDLHRCFDAALTASMQRRNTNWYMSTLDDDSYFWKNGYDGNWIGTSFMMSTFPWDASLKGFPAGGAWKDAFDRSIAQALHLRTRSRHGIPRGSWGAWWGHEYGSCYNAGMGLQLLFSDEHRTEVIKNLEFLLDNQSAPFQWGESFDRARSDSDWTVPAADYETWGLGFDQQALLEACISVKTDGTVIIGRGIPDEWLKDGSVIAWKNVRINGGRKLDFSLSANTTTVTLRLDGERPSGKIIFDLPAFKGRIASIQADGMLIERGNAPGGGIELRPDVTTIAVDLRNP